MKTRKQLEEICIEIYKELYKNAQPQVDFEELIKSGETKKSGWFLSYYLSDKIQEAIIKIVLKKHKCTAYEKRIITSEIMLGCSPVGVKRIFKNTKKWT